MRSILLWSWMATWTMLPVQSHAALVEQNLLDKHHPEFVDLFVDTLPTEVQRGAYATAAWKF